LPSILLPHLQKNPEKAKFPNAVFSVITVKTPRRKKSKPPFERMRYPLSRGGFYVLTLNIVSSLEGIKVMLGGKPGGKP